MPRSSNQHIVIVPRTLSLAKTATPSGKSSWSVCDRISRNAPHSAHSKRVLPGRGSSGKTGWVPVVAHSPTRKASGCSAGLRRHAFGPIAARDMSLTFLLNRELAPATNAHTRSFLTPRRKLPPGPRTPADRQDGLSLEPHRLRGSDRIPRFPIRQAGAARAPSSDRQR